VSGQRAVRTYTVAETLHAIAREVARPRPGGIGLAAPTGVVRLHDCEGQPPLVRLGHPAISSILRWIQVLDDVTTVTLTGFHGSNVYAEATGRIPRGPVIAVGGWVFDLDLDTPLADGVDRILTIDELRHLAGAPITPPTA
jgi:hypothetical protein